MTMTNDELLKKLDNHEIMLRDMGINIANNSRMLIKLENYMIFIEKDIMVIKEVLERHFKKVYEVKPKTLYSSSNSNI